MTMARRDPVGSSDAPCIGSDVVLVANDASRLVYTCHASLSPIGARAKPLHREGFTAGQKMAFGARQLGLLGMISHDLRTPLSVIRSAAYELEAGGGADVGRRRTLGERIRRNSEQVLALANNLVSLAEVQSGQLALDLKPIDLRSLILEAATEMEMLAGGRCAIACSLPNEPAVTQVDVRRLRQILHNLLDNAIRFASGMVWLTLSSEAAYTRISVADDGDGLPEHGRDRLFEPFARAHAARQSRSGLGLAIVRELVEAHGGKVSAGNRLDQAGSGARFDVWLPVGRPLEQESS
jgi:signal transduction histidine kinase